MPCMKREIRTTRPIANRRVLLGMSWVNITPMVMARFMTRWCVWRRIFPCPCPCWMVRVTLVRWMGIIPRPCVIPKCAWINHRLFYWRTLIRTLSISRTTMMAKIRNQRFCLRGSQICWSMGRVVLLWVWPPTSRRTTWVK